MRHHRRRHISSRYELNASPKKTASGTVGIAKESSLVIGVDNFAMRTHALGRNLLTHTKDNLRPGLTIPLDAKEVAGDSTVKERRPYALAREAMAEGAKKERLGKYLPNQPRSAESFPLRG